MLSTEILSQIEKYNSLASNHNILDFINLDKLNHFGIPSDSSAEMAFHNIQGILALGTLSGDIKM